MGSSAARPTGRRRVAGRAPTRRADGRSSPPATAKPTGKRRSQNPSSRRGGGSRRAAAAGRSAAPRRAGAAGPRWRRRLLTGTAIAAVLVAGYFAWLRDSSLVAVTNVTVNGVESGETGQIEAALTRAGEGMTTLNVDEGALERVAARFPTVGSVSADPSFPHDLTIEVGERPPALVARDGEREVAVAADGVVLPGVEAPEELPRLELEEVPGSGRLEGDALAQARVLGAAPDPLVPLVRRVRLSRAIGVEVRMRGGLELRFGTGARAGAKWAAAAAVLADPGLESASYVDVRVPRKPAVGGTQT